MSKVLFTGLILIAQILVSISNDTSSSPAFVAAVQASNNTQNQTLPAFVATAGGTTVVGIGWHNAGAPSIAINSVCDGTGGGDNCTGSQTYTHIGTRTDSANNSVSIYCANGVNAGSTTITTTFQASGSGSGQCALHYTGVASCTPDSSSQASSNTGTAMDSGSGSATSIANDVVIGIAYSNPSNSIAVGTDGNGHTMNSRATNNATILCEDFIETGTLTPKATGTADTSGEWNMGMVALHP